jgi:hypothetical protein
LAENGVVFSALVDDTDLAGPLSVLVLNDDVNLVALE